MELSEYATMFEAEDRHWWYVGLRRLLLSLWRRHLRVERPAVLDVGCGTGANLAALNGLAAPAVGVDFAPEAVRLCRTRKLSCTAVASALALPFDGQSFDVVVSCDVLCHSSIPDKGVALNEIHRVLRGNGLVFLNLPAYQWLLSSHDRAYRTDRRFTRAAVLELLRTTGFEPVTVTYWNTFLFPAAVAVRAWRNFTGSEGSDLVAGSARPAGGLLGAVLGLERALIRLIPLPFGLSVLAVGRKAA
jgi:ubiquinone/menaquinone biosynthesis C-methylase UbiE